MHNINLFLSVEKALYSTHIDLDQGNLLNAKTTVSKIFEECKKFPSLAVRVLEVQAKISHIQGNLVEAQAHIDTAMNILQQKKLKGPLEAMVQARQAQLTGSRGDMPKALDYLREAKGVCSPQQGMDVLEIQLIQWYLEPYQFTPSIPPNRQMSRWKWVCSILKTEMDHKIEANFKYLIALQEQARGKGALKQRKFKEAKDTFCKSSQTLYQLGCFNDACYSQLSYVSVLIGLGQLKKACQELEKANKWIQNIKKVPNDDLFFDVFYRILTNRLEGEFLFCEEGQISDAIEKYKLCLELIIDKHLKYVIQPIYLDIYIRYIEISLYVGDGELNELNIEFHTKYFEVKYALMRVEFNIMNVIKFEESIQQLEIYLEIIKTSKELGCLEQKELKAYAIRLQAQFEQLLFKKGALKKYEKARVLFSQLGRDGYLEETKIEFLKATAYLAYENYIFAEECFKKVEEKAKDYLFNLSKIYLKMFKERLKQEDIPENLTSCNRFYFANMLKVMALQFAYQGEFSQAIKLLEKINKTRQFLKEKVENIGKSPKEKDKYPKERYLHPERLSDYYYYKRIQLQMESQKKRVVEKTISSNYQDKTRLTDLSVSVFFSKISQKVKGDWKTQAHVIGILNYMLTKLQKFIYEREVLHGIQFIIYEMINFLKKTKSEKVFYDLELDLILCILYFLELQYIVKSKHTRSLPYPNKKYIFGVNNYLKNYLIFSKKIQYLSYIIELASLEYLTEQSKKIKKICYICCDFFLRQETVAKINEIIKIHFKLLIYYRLNYIGKRRESCSEIDDFKISLTKSKLDGLDEKEIKKIEGFINYIIKNHENIFDSLKKFIPNLDHSLIKKWSFIKHTSEKYEKLLVIRII